MLKWSYTTAVAAMLMCSQPASAQIKAEVYAGGFIRPVGVVQDPRTHLIQYVVEQEGRVRIIRNRQVQTEPFLDVSQSISCCGERGLLGLVFAPDYEASGRFFIRYTDVNGNTVVARGRRSDLEINPLRAEPALVPLVWASIGNLPYIPHVPAYGNHNGGDLAFGPDGFLYIGMGDGGSANDPQHHAQNPNQLLGKMLRVDVNVGETDPNGYRVPPDNPFVDGAPVAALPEIWAFGLRNPWRFSFDSGPGGSGGLLIADVGQGRFEEVNYQAGGVGGLNYGWRNREGAHEHIETAPPAYTPLRNPIHEYGRASGQSISGGYVYRGNLLGPAFRGRYFFGDFVSGRVWSFALVPGGESGLQATDVQEHTTQLGPTMLGNISAFGVDYQGELFIVSYFTGLILKIAPVVSAPTGVRVVQ